MKRSLIPLTCMLYTAIELHLVGAISLPMTFPYTLQATPIAFTEEPESMSVLQGTTVTLSCNTTILWNDNYKLPELIWRYNGQLLDGNHPSHFIRTHPNNSRSELTIMGVSQENNGYYECIARDGYHLLEGGDASYFYIIASQTARLKVIDVDLNVSEGVETVSVVVGQHLLLPCETGAMNPPEQSTWMKDGVEVTGNENEVVLGNGSLLILVAVEETEGSYQCTGYYNHEPLNSTTYNVSLSQASQGGSGADPVVIIDGPAGVIEVGEWVNLTCYILNSERLQVQWLKDGQILSVTEKMLAMRASVQDSGTYSCQFMSSSAVLATSDFNIIIANKPVVELSGCRELYPEQPCGDDAIRPKSYFERSITLTCSTSDPLASIHWYKNGQNFTMYSRNNTLRYSGGTYDDLLGIYQCFAVTPAGTSYDTVRVLREGFTNAPGNFTCQAVDQTSNISLPSVILSWEQPTLQAYNVNSDGFAVPPQGGSYKIVYEANGVNNSRTVDAKSTTTLIDLPMDGQYTFWVYFDHNDEQLLITAISECKNDTFIRRTAVPRRLMVSCPESIPSDDHSDNITIPVKWISPVKSPNIFGIDFVLLRSVCLQNSTIREDELLARALFNLRDDEIFSFEVGPLLPGAVCLFGGYYQLLDRGLQLFDILFVPSESCGIPAPQSTGEAQLKLTCSDSVATFEVVTAVGDAALNLTGLCISVNWEDRFIPPTEYYLAPGNSSISGLPDDTICTYYGSYQLQTSEVVDFEPVQCIMNHPLSLPTTTEDITTNFAPTSTSAATTTESASEGGTTGSLPEDEVTTDTPEIIKPGTGSGFSLSPSALTWVAVDLSLALLVIVVLIIACFTWKSYSRKRIKEQKNRLHMWDNFLTQQEGEDSLDQDPHVLPQFPCVSHAPDSLSITTEVDYLYKEEGRTLLSHTSLSSLMKSMKNDEKAIDSPKLIMDRFLNGCHQRVWESSHESLSNVPQSSTREQSSSKLTELHGTETSTTYDGTDPISSKSHMASNSDSVPAQHYAISLQMNFSNQLAVDSYIPSGGSSGYGTGSDHYFESGSSTYTSTTNDYFKSRLADVAECNSLSTCGEEEEKQQTSVVDIMKRSRDSCHDPVLTCEMRLDSDITPCISTDTDKHRTHHPIKSTGNHKSITTQCAGHTSHGVTCTNSNLISRHRDFTPSSIPPEHYFTDDEGYLRFSKETTV